MKRANRILLIITQADWGGAQSFLLHFAQDLQKEGREVLLAAGGEGELWERAKASGIKTQWLEHVRRDIDPAQDLLAIREIRDLIDSWKPDAIHLNSSKIGVIGSIAAKQSTTNPWVVYRIGGWAFLEPMAEWKRWIYRTAEQQTAHLKDVIITLHPGDEKLARDTKIAPRGWLSTVPNGLDTPTFVARLKTRQAARTELKIPQDAFVFGTIAGAYSTKGLLPYLDVLADALRRNPNAYGVIIGDGPEEFELRKKYQTLDVRDRILLPGFVDGTVLYNAFDVFVLPSRKEGMPWTVLEAMASGVPVIATDVGACRWMLLADGEQAGVIVPPQDPKALLAAMDELRANQIERQHLSEGGCRQLAHRFSWNETLRGNREALDGMRPV